MPEATKFLLADNQIPSAWMNVLPLLKGAARPAAAIRRTHQPLAPADAGADLPDGADRAGILAEAGDRHSRRGPGYLPAVACHAALSRAALEKALDTPAHIYYKYEGTSPAGSHKPNTAVAQAYYNKRAGIHRLATETGAGQWGSALALACQHVRPGMHGLHGAGELRSKAVSPHDDARLGRGGFPQPERPAPIPGARCWLPRRIRPAAWASPSAKRWKTPPRIRTPITRWAACSTTSCCTRP